MARLRLGVIGVGHLGKEHARILAGLPAVDLIGVADVNEELAHSVAQRLGCRAFSGFRPLLHLVDAVVVAVPTTSHYTVATEFLRCGIPLLVEKPLASTLQEAENLVHLARRQRTFLQVGHIERFNPAFEELQRYLFQPKFVDCERIGPFTGRSADVGVILDLMIHDLDILLTLVEAPVRSIEGLGLSVFGAHEDVANVRLTFESGCIANMSASRVSPVVRRRMRIWSPEGFVGLDYQKSRLSLIQQSEQVRRQGLDPAKLDAASRAMLKEELFGRHLHVLERDCTHKVDQLTRELEHFVDCVRFGKSPRVSGEDGRDAIALATEIIEVIRNHQWEGHPAGPTGPNHLPRPRGVLFYPTAGDAAA
jgi:predicted dehydrogenase